MLNSNNNRFDLLAAKLRSMAVAISNRWRNLCNIILSYRTKILRADRPKGVNTGNNKKTSHIETSKSAILRGEPQLKCRPSESMLLTRFGFVGQPFYLEDSDKNTPRQNKLLS